jgi:hypothetical protein
VRELLDEYDRQKAGNPCRSARAVCASVEIPREVDAEVLDILGLSVVIAEP